MMQVARARRYRDRALLLRKDLVQIVAKPMQGLAARIGDAEIEQVVREMRSGQKLRGEIRDAARIASPVVFHAFDGALEEPLACGQRKRDIEIMFRRGSLEPAHLAAQVVEKGLLNFVGGEAGAGFFG
jgi:hypothetical protein